MKNRSKKPPVFARWLLHFYLRKEDRHHRLGDFEEVYQYLANKDGRFTAWRWYWFQIIKSTPELLINFAYFGGFMFKNNLKIALRNIKNHKLYSFISISGVAVCIATCFLILKYVSFELSYGSG